MSSHFEPGRINACFDRDEKVHRVLVKKIFPAQATVITVEEFINVKVEMLKR